MNDRTERRAESTEPAPTSVAAVVLTHRRPRLASDVVRSLIEIERVAPRRITVVVNGSGGLDDAALEGSINILRLPRNLGPAGGFGAGMERVFSDPSVEWAYLCEDDIGLYPLPSPRLGDLVERAGRAAESTLLGAVVAYGRCFTGRGAHTINVAPPPGPPLDLHPIDVASWGATLISRSVIEAGVLPDPSWFFGLEDFDFFWRLHRAGLAVLLDGEAARSVVHQQTSAGREAALRANRPVDVEEAWRFYYHARNSVTFARRHGRPSWHLWHLVYSGRQLQVATDWGQRRALLHGLWDGARGRKGEHPGYRRADGERSGSGAA